MNAKERLDEFEREWRMHLRKLQTAPAGQPYYIKSEPDPVFLRSNIPSKLREVFMSKFDLMVNRELEALQAGVRRQLVNDALDEARDTIARLEGEPAPEPEPKDFPEWPEGAEEKP